MSPDHLEKMKHTLARIAEASHFGTLAYFEAEREAWCQKILASANVPPFRHHVRLHPDGTWTDDLSPDWSRHLDDIPGPCMIVDPMGLIERRDGVGSQTWHAYHMMQCLHHLRQARITQDLEWALAALYRLFNAWLFALWELELEPDATAGKKVRRGGKTAWAMRETANRSRWTQERAKWQRLAEQIWATSPTLSEREVARQIGRLTGRSPHTIRRYIEHPQKKVDQVLSPDPRQSLQ